MSTFPGGAVAEIRYLREGIERLLCNARADYKKYGGFSPAQSTVRRMAKDAIDEYEKLLAGPTRKNDD